MADPFANLGVKASNKGSAGLSMQERQKQQLAERQRQLQAQARGSDADAAFWDSFGSAKPATVSNKPIPNHTPQNNNDDDEDLFAAFNSTAPVDKSSHFPPPSSSSNLSIPGSRDASNSRRTSPAPPSQPAATALLEPDDDDDPFGLGAFERKRPVQQRQQRPPQAIGDNDDDDFLGDLGKPVSEIPKRQSHSPLSGSNGLSNGHPGGHPADGAVAELVDMGFPVDKAREALAHTDSGTNVQAAVGWLLNQAHAETGSRNSARAQDQNRDASRGRPSRTESPANGQPAWMRGSGATSGQDSRSPASRERDPAKVASEFGSNLAKTAGSFWKSARKQAQKAIADFQQPEADSAQPRWMREAQAREEAESRQEASRQEASRQPASRQQAPPEQSNLTDEAMLLDMPAPERPKKQQPNGRSTPHASSGRSTPLDHPPLSSSPRNAPSSTTSHVMPQSLPPRPRPSERLTRQQVEEQSAQVYVSSNRRRKPPAEPKPEPVSEAPVEPSFASADDAFDVFNAPAPAPKSTASSQPSRSKPSSSRTSTPVTVRPKAAARSVPQTNPASLSSSHAERQKGTEAYKRGDYATAQTHYTAALSSLPASHPILIVLHCNRSLTNIKTGDPKAAIADAEAALAIIGPSRGESESVSLSTDEGDKPMKEFFGKALMRKAEAYEHMEKWQDAAKIWHEAVEANVGGAVAIQGRNRCEKAAAPKPKAAPPKKPPPARPPPRKSAMQDLNGSAGGESDAVKRLRAANEAASAASDEQFALTDVVTARLDAWKGTKKDNLRALLASMDAVLWADAGWNKVGMSDLVMPNRVKIVYMKAIAKVHPDKLSQNATTEQKMISAAVFATLNEAWDKFKADNNL